MILLDTCVLIYDALRPEQLSTAASTTIDDAEQQGTLCCSDISLWEIAMLVDRGRVDPGVDSLTFLKLTLTARSITVLPITPEIAHRSVGLQLNGDPADRIIAATAIEHSAHVVTSDSQLRQSTEVPTIW